MEKLLELLNEYEEDKIKESKWLDVMYIWKNEWTLHYYDNYKDENVFDNVRFLIISKVYWFIKWLVDNDKIDRWKIEERISGDVSLYLDNREYYWRYKWLLMLLSIQDNPIEFLISVLK